jgi:hypothetical protein
MSVARDIALDSSGDWEVLASTGDLRLVSDEEAIVQAVGIALQFVRGEWFLDLEFGVPYFQDVLIKNPSPDVLHSVFRAAILGVKGISAVTSLVLSLDRATRTLSVTWSATSDVGLLSSTVEL